MLKTFIRFEETNYCEDQACSDSTVCFSGDPVEDYALILKPADEIKFIIDKSQAGFYAAEHLLLNIADECGNIIEVAGTIEESEDQYFCTFTVPELTGQHTLTIERNVLVYLSSFTPETNPGDCDAEITISINNPPTSLFEYSVDGINYQESTTFTGLCQEPLTIYVREQGDTCDSGITNIDISPVVCGDYEGATLQDVIDDGIYLGQVLGCTLDDFIL